MPELLTIAPPSADFPREVLDSPGGFVWWYLDLFDAERNGVVLIWSYGLPFLPGYASAARAGDAQLPRARPSLNVAVYDEGKLRCYLLQEFRPEQASWGDQEWTFGRSRVRTVVEGGRRRVEVELDCDLPGGDRLTGNVALEGVARTCHPGDRYAGHHDWAPMTGPAEGRYVLSAGPVDYGGQGRAYFDGNVGSAPLHDAGIHSWTWGRVPLRDRERIYYVLWSEGEDRPYAVGIEIDDRGELSRFALDVRVDAWRRGRGTLRYPSRLRLFREGERWLDVHATESVVDDGPFYLRYFIEADGIGGIGEYCRTDRIDLGVHRPLVRMRVHRVNDDNSMWLPLFSGPRQGRITRLVSQFVGRAS